MMERFLFVLMWRRLQSTRQVTVICRSIIYSPSQFSIHLVTFFFFLSTTFFFTVLFCLCMFLKCAWIQVSGNAVNEPWQNVQRTITQKQKSQNGLVSYKPCKKYSIVLNQIESRNPPLCCSLIPSGGRKALICDCIVTFGFCVSFYKFHLQMMFNSRHICVYLMQKGRDSLSTCLF